MRQVVGDDVIHRTIDAALQCGYKLIGKLLVIKNIIKNKKYRAIIFLFFILFLPPLLILISHIDIGYFIDTAAVYRNEADIGWSLKQLMPKYGLSRADIFLTSKLCES